MVNKPEDIGALFSFLRLAPASNPRVFTQVGVLTASFFVVRVVGYHIYLFVLFRVIMFDVMWRFRVLASCFLLCGFVRVCVSRACVAFFSPRLYRASFYLFLLCELNEHTRAPACVRSFLPRAILGELFCCLFSSLDRTDAYARTPTCVRRL